MISKVVGTFKTHSAYMLPQLPWGFYLLVDVTPAYQFQSFPSGLKFYSSLHALKPMLKTDLRLTTQYLQPNGCSYYHCSIPADTSSLNSHISPKELPSALCKLAIVHGIDSLSRIFQSLLECSIWFPMGRGYTTVFIGIGNLQFFGFFQ